MLTKIDEKKIEKIVASTVVDAINDVVIPAMDRMEERLRNDLVSKKDLEEFKNQTIMHFDSLERKFDAAQDRMDKHDARITTLEKVHPQGKHALA